MVHRTTIVGELRTRKCFSSVSAAPIAPRNDPEHSPVIRSGRRRGRRGGALHRAIVRRRHANIPNRGDRPPLYADFYAELSRDFGTRHASCPGRSVETPPVEIEWRPLLTENISEHPVRHGDPRAQDRRGFSRRDVNDAPDAFRSPLRRLVNGAQSFVFPSGHEPEWSQGFASRGFWAPEMARSVTIWSPSPAADVDAWPSVCQGSVPTGPFVDSVKPLLLASRQHHWLARPMSAG